MKYSNGGHVAVGDRVELWGDRHGTVVCSIDTGDFAADYPKSEWGYLGSGVVIRTDSADVFHYMEPDEDFKLIESAARGHLKAGSDAKLITSRQMPLARSRTSAGNSSEV